MKTFLFALGVSCGVAGFILSAGNLITDLVAIWRKRREEQDNA